MVPVAKQMKIKITTSIDLDAGTRERMIPMLNARLADTIDLYTQIKQAHWNVKGSNFIALHKLFDDLAEEILAYSDSIAERAVQLGGLALGTSRIVAKESKLEEYPSNITSEDDHVREVTKRLATYAKLLRKAIDTADDAGDAVTADLFTEVTRGVDKQLWFVEAHLGG